MGLCALHAHGIEEHDPECLYVHVASQDCMFCNPPYSQALEGSIDSELLDKMITAHQETLQGVDISLKKHND